MATTLISVYSIFIIFFITSAIKNLFVNSNGYSRFLRISITFVVIGYLLYVGFLSIRPINALGGNMHWNIQDTLSIISFFIISIVSLGTLIVADFKKNSVRDAWKYSAVVFKTYKTDKPKDLWKLTFKIIVALAIASAMALNLAIYNFATDWNIIVTTTLLVVHISLNYLGTAYYRNELLNKNVRYNLLKEYVFKMNEKEHSETDKHVGEKILKLYREIFQESWFYKRRIDTNNAVIYDIYQRTGCKRKNTEEYFREPHTKRRITIEEYERLMNIGKK